MSSLTRFYFKTFSMARYDLEMTNTHRKRSILSGNGAQEVDSSTANVAGAIVIGLPLEKLLASFVLVIFIIVLLPNL